MLIRACQGQGHGNGKHCHPYGCRFDSRYQGWQEPETEQNDGGEPCSLNSESLVKDRVSMQES
jgi:hypothetical protein